MNPGCVPSRHGTSKCLPTGLSGRHGQPWSATRPRHRVVCRCSTGPSPIVSIAGGHLQVRWRGQRRGVRPESRPSGAPIANHVSACRGAGPSIAYCSDWIAGSRLPAWPPRRLRLLPANLVLRRPPVAAFTTPAATSPQPAAVYSFAEARGPPAAATAAAAVTHGGHAPPVLQRQHRGGRVAPRRQRGVRSGAPVGLHGRRRRRRPASQRQSERFARPRVWVSAPPRLTPVVSGTGGLFTALISGLVSCVPTSRLFHGLHWLTLSPQNAVRCSAAVHGKGSTS